MDNLSNDQEIKQLFLGVSQEARDNEEMLTKAVSSRLLMQTDPNQQQKQRFRMFAGLWTIAVVGCLVLCGSFYFMTESEIRSFSEEYEWLVILPSALSAFFIFTGILLKTSSKLDVRMPIKD